MAKCYFADGAPLGLIETAEDGWGAVQFNHLWVSAHRAKAYRTHDDGNGRCKVCGIAIDFDAWADASDRAAGGSGG